MIIELAAYRQKKQAQRSWTTHTDDEELVCVNWEAPVIRVQRVIPVPPVPSPELPTCDDDLAAFHQLAYTLATQI